MSVLWIIYLIIGIILAFMSIQSTFKANEDVGMERDVNKVAKDKNLGNIGTIALFVFVIVIGLFVTFLWPVFLIIAALLNKKRKNDGNN